jgi:hypothetical protein
MVISSDRIPDGGHVKNWALQHSSKRPFFRKSGATLRDRRPSHYEFGGCGYEKNPTEARSGPLRETDLR